MLVGAPCLVAMDAQTIVDTVAALDETTAVSIITAILQSRPELAPPVVTFAVPDLTYPPSKALNERRSKGTIKSFNTEKGFGFVDCEELNMVFGNDVFVHGKQIGEFTPGTAVSFAVVLNKDNRPQAYDIQHDPPKGMFGKGTGGVSDAPGGWVNKGAGKNISNEGWTDFSAGFNASAMMEMMSQKWGGTCGGGKGSMGGGTIRAAGCGGSTGNLQVQPSQVIGTFIGTIKSFNPKSGFGFIVSADLKAAGHDKDVFLMHQQMEDFEVGAQVQFTAFLNNKGSPQAKDLVDPFGEGAAPKQPKLAGFSGGIWGAP